MFMQGPYQLDRSLLDGEIYFNDSCQDVMSLIGTPSSVYYKSEELNKTSDMSLSNFTQQNDYFYNYITLGIDVLFSSETNTATKFILHSNFPCHYNFNSYFMCNFEIPITVAETNQVFVVTPSTTVSYLSTFDN